MTPSPPPHDPLAHRATSSLPCFWKGVPKPSLNVCFYSQANPETQVGRKGRLEGDTWRGWEIPREASYFPSSHLPGAPQPGLARRCLCADRWDHSQTWPSEGARVSVPRSPAAEGTGASCLGGEELCLGGSKDKALLGRKGQGSGKGYADFSPARRWWQECSYWPQCLATPPWLRPRLRVGGSLQAHQTHALGWGTGTGETQLPLWGLWAEWSFVMFGAASVDPERRCHMRLPRAHGWERHGWGPMGQMSCAVASPSSAESGGV